MYTCERRLLSPVRRETGPPRKCFCLVRVLVEGSQSSSWNTFMLKIWEETQFAPAHPRQYDAINVQITFTIFRPSSYGLSPVESANIFRAWFRILYSMPFARVLITHANTDTFAKRRKIVYTFTGIWTLVSSTHWVHNWPVGWENAEPHWLSLIKHAINRCSVLHIQLIQLVVQTGSHIPNYKNGMFW